ncbi:hypothetical protein acsn021_02620 [Anaerocolumna cellulosilytica]|uniref:Uncharacterized protein n=1 Tax=Anaerocolumna cellulosilytica TaxID=433286 RepID=A0A6S6QMX4_9FIRM|nr:hypothetical protein [Anaerocolumna cellulosilytica]MBB5196905.1 hypothetical protein [Anaerocolumna cellulosilytica]BCJ92693.1 hypothetical protein acsn021_02620 [Anaerocolumna cellulosilytica]
MFIERTTVAEKIIELRNKRNQIQERVISEDDLDNGFVVINQKVYEIEEMALAEGKFTMSMPTEFGLLDESLAESKYPNLLRPQYIYSDKTTGVNITFTIDDKKIDAEEVEELKENLICILSDLHPEYEIIDEVIIHGDDLTIATFGFIKSTLDGELYQMIFLMSLNEKLLLGGFNCNAQVKEEWYPVIHQMVQTIRPIN